MASSSFPLLETKTKRVQSREGLKSIPQPSLMPDGLSPASSGRAEGRLLADHSLVEVDVAQVLGWLFGGTHFLVIVDHPPGEWRKGQRRVSGGPSTWPWRGFWEESRLILCHTPRSTIQLASNGASNLMFPFDGLRLFI